jgi:hypothetical protein
MCGFHKMQGVSLLAEELLVSQERLRFVEVQMCRAVSACDTEVCFEGVLLRTASFCNGGKGGCQKGAVVCECSLTVVRHSGAF